MPSRLQEGDDKRMQSTDRFEESKQLSPSLESDPLF